MASITLDRDECGEGFLPPVCVRCGEAAPNSQKQTFHWFPPLIYLLLIPVCTLPLYIILVIILRKSRTVLLPVCNTHRGLWMQRRLLTGLGIFLMIVGVYATLGVFLIRAAHDPAGNASLLWFTAVSSFVHAAIMAVQAMGDPMQRGHLTGDVPALLLVTVVIAVLLPREMARGSRRAQV